MSHALSFRLLVLVFVAASISSAALCPHPPPCPPHLTVRPLGGYEHVAVGSRIVLDNATAWGLTAVPGIGPGLARRIVAGGPYRSCEDLLRVKGIGRQRLKTLCEFVALGGGDF